MDRDINEIGKLNYSYVLNESFSQMSDSKLEESTDLSESFYLDYAYVLNESFHLKEDNTSNIAYGLNGYFCKPEIHAAFEKMKQSEIGEERIKAWNEFSELISSTQEQWSIARHQRAVDTKSLFIKGLNGDDLGEDYDTILDEVKTVAKAKYPALNEVLNFEVNNKEKPFETIIKNMIKTYVSGNECVGGTASTANHEKHVPPMENGGNGRFEFASGGY